MSDLDLSVFRESKRVFALVDNDPGSSVVRTRFIRNCEEHDIPHLRLEKYAIENYTSINALRKVFPYQIPTSFKTIASNIKFDDQIGFSKKKKSVKPKIHQVFELMSQADIEETDLWGFITMVDEILRQESNLEIE